MNKIFTYLIFILQTAIVANAQNIERRDATFEDYLPLLKSSGYELYSFDISSLGKDYTYTPDILEVEGYGKPVSLFGDWKCTFNHDTPATRLNVGFHSMNDSTMMVSLNVVGMANLDWNLKLHPRQTREMSNSYYSMRSFKVEKFKSGDFIPLALVGESWFDEEEHLYRFCGESELSSDKSSSMLQKIPHYYIIGVEITKKR